MEQAHLDPRPLTPYPRDLNTQPTCVVPAMLSEEQSTAPGAFIRSCCATEDLANPPSEPVWLPAAAEPDSLLNLARLLRALSAGDLNRRKGHHNPRTCPRGRAVGAGRPSLCISLVSRSPLEPRAGLLRRSIFSPSATFNSDVRFVGESASSTVTTCSRVAAGVAGSFVFVVCSGALAPLRRPLMNPCATPANGAASDFLLSSTLSMCCLEGRRFVVLRAVAASTPRPATPAEPTLIH